MKTYTLPANQSLQKLAWNGKEFVPKDLVNVATVSPYTYTEGSTGQSATGVTSSYVSFTEDYYIDTDETKFLTDGNGNIFEYLVGSRPKHRPKQ